MLNDQTFFEVLSDATRRRILLLLISGSERCVCELFEALDLPQPKVSRHLAVLRDAGVVVTSKSGTWVYYRLNPNLPLWATRILDLLAGAMGETAANERRGSKAACC
jgi:ArsR family transcriptional regulator, arsenate/arsenite/antimonite-responsive transcriptional repressor